MLASVIFRAKNIKKNFGGQTVLGGVTVELREGEIVLLRGDNGSGKTTLLNILSGNLEPDAGVIEFAVNSHAEHITFPRPWWRELNPLDHFTPERVAKEGVGRTWQDIRLFPTLDLQNNIAVALPRQIGENPAWAVLRRTAVKRQEQENLSHAHYLLSEVGLEERDISSADRISLGQSKRVAIARAVHAGAKVLFLDEPFAGLDNEGISQILQLIDSINSQHKVTVVIVEHVFHIPLLLTHATTVWTLARGEIRVDPPATVQKNFTQSQHDAIEDWMRGLAAPGGAITKKELHGGATLLTLTPEHREARRPVLEVNDLLVRRGKRLVTGREVDGRFEGLSFSLMEGEISFLRAPNGWGKSTLFEALAGLLTIAQGEIKFCGQPFQTLPAWERSRLGLSLLQARNHTFPTLTVREVLSLANGGGRAKIERVPQGLRSLFNRRVSELSGGEKQKVALHCALESEHFRLWLLDEPFSMLDRVAITQSLERIGTGGKTVLIAMPGNR